MKLSEQWLREWVKTPLETQKLLQCLTMAGHELETLEAVPDFEDNCIEIDFTPNRGDCLSVMGIARETAAIVDGTFTTPITFASVSATSEATFPITIEAQEDCPRYIGRVIENINIQAKTPEWMTQRLAISGIRSIDPVVDVTNYVMLELGQPLHAFDKNTLHERIIVRRAQKNEMLTLLNGQKIQLAPDTLVIADTHKILALAGIMGGEHSGVSAETKNIFLESAFFNPITIAGRAMRYGLHTDSSHRFERGVDFALTEKAIERASELLLTIVGGKPGPIVNHTAQAYLPERSNITLRQSRIERLLGIDFTPTAIENLLTRLHFQINPQEKNVWQVQAPSYRFDISREVDLVEEIARLHGYNNIPLHSPMTQVSNQTVNIQSQQNRGRLRALLVNRGYQEIISYSFVEPKIQQIFDPNNVALQLANPISADMAVMRTSIWPGLLTTVIYNQNRQQERLRLFEVGQCFLQTEKNLNQDVRIAGIITGSVYPEQWGISQRTNDFFDLKGDVESLLKILAKNKKINYQTVNHSALHPGQSCQILCDNMTVGYMGGLNPQILQLLDCAGPIYLFELTLKTLENEISSPYQALIKFPAIRRDIALVIDTAITAQQIQELITTTAGELLRKVEIFDVYQGKGIEPGKKSVALALHLQHADRTLKDEEVNQVMAGVVTTLEQQLHAKLR